MRRSDDLVLAALPARFDQMEARVSGLEGGLAHNTSMTTQIFENTQSIVAATQAASSMWAFLSKWVSRARRWSYFSAKWIAAIAGAFAATWAATKAVFGIDLSDMIVHWWRAR